MVLQLGRAFGLLMAMASLCVALPSLGGALGGVAGAVGSLLGSSGNVQLIYQLLPTMGPENCFLRSNGQLLVTCINCNTLSQLDPTLGPTQIRRTVYTFPETVISVTGIDQLMQDVFVVGVAEANIPNPLQLLTLNFTGLVQGTTGVWIVDLRGYQAPAYNSGAVQAYKVGGTNTGLFFDGLAVINATRGLVATTDFLEGNIWLVDIQQNTTTILVEQPVLPPQNGQASSLILANGMKYNNSKLYFTASQDGTFGYVPVDPNTGAATGPVQVIYNYGFTIDDFNFGPSGNTYITTLARIPGGVLERAAGTPNGVSGTTMPVNYYGTNSVIPVNVAGGMCELLMTDIMRYQVIKATIPGPC